MPACSLRAPAALPSSAPAVVCSVAALKHRELNPHSLEGLETLVGYGVLSSQHTAGGWGGGARKRSRAHACGAAREPTTGARVLTLSHVYA